MFKWKKFHSIPLDPPLPLEEYEVQLLFGFDYMLHGHWCGVVWPHHRLYIGYWAINIVPKFHTNRRKSTRLVGFNWFFYRNVSRNFEKFSYPENGFSAACTTEVHYSLIGKPTVNFKGFHIFVDFLIKCFKSELRAWTLSQREQSNTQRRARPLFQLGVSVLDRTRFYQKVGQ